jgi:hypothetical protein
MQDLIIAHVKLSCTLISNDFSIGELSPKSDIKN